MFTNIEHVNSKVQKYAIYVLKAIQLKSHIFICENGEKNPTQRTKKWPIQLRYPLPTQFSILAFNEILALGVKFEEYHRNHAKCHGQCAKNKSFVWFIAQYCISEWIKYRGKNPEI